MTRGVGRAACRAGSFAVVAAALAVVGCDPCAGTVECRVAPQISYTGKVIDFASGRGAAGVGVSFRRTAGAALVGDSLVGVTDTEGRFRLTGRGSGPGTIVGALSVRPPGGLAPYTVSGITLDQSSVAGGGGVLPTFVTQPYVDFVGELLYRRSGGPLAYSTVTFRRTAGARLAGPDSLQRVAGPDGWFYVELPALDGDSVVGDLTVQYFELPRSFSVRGVRLPVRYTDRLPTLTRSFLIGSSFDYIGELRQRGTGLPVVGADLEFRRTGGTPLAAPVYTARSNADGRFALELVPTSESGSPVVGDITVRAPSLRAPYVVRGVTDPRERRGRAVPVPGRAGRGLPGGPGRGARAARGWLAAGGRRGGDRAHRRDRHHAAADRRTVALRRALRSVAGCGHGRDGGRRPAGAVGRRSIHRDHSRRPASRGRRRLRALPRPVHRGSEPALRR